MSFETDNRKESQVPTPSPLELKDDVYPEQSARTDRYGRKKQFAIPATILGLILTGGFLGHKALNNEKETPATDPLPTAEAPVVPGEVPVEPAETAEPTPEVVDVSPESLRISAELPADQLAQQSIDLLNEWRFADATADTIDAVDQGWYDYDGGLADYIASYAEENAALYSAAIFADDWQSSPPMVELYESYLESNKAYIETNLARKGREMPLITLESQISDVKEYSAVAEMDPKDISPLYEVVKEQINLRNARVISYTGTPLFENSEQADVTPQHVVQVFDITDGTARLITQTATPIQ